MFGGPDRRHRRALRLLPLSRGPVAPGLHEYTLMPIHLHTLFTPDELRSAPRSPPRSTSPRGCRCCATRPCPAPSGAPMQDGTGFADIGTVLFDLVQDPRQERPMRDESVEARLRDGIRAELEAHDAPVEFLRALRASVRASNTMSRDGWPTRPSDRPFPLRPTSVTISSPKTRRPDLGSGPDAEEFGQREVQNEPSPEASSLPPWAPRSSCRWRPRASRLQPRR